MKNFFYLLLMFVALLPEITQAAALPGRNMSPKIKETLLGNYARQFLDLQQWDTLYEGERRKDITYLLGSIKDSSLTQLTSVQKTQVIKIMQDMALKQLSKDKEYFKSYLIGEYSKFFTQDELNMLINYYKTSTMQMIVKDKVALKTPTIDEISESLNKQTTAEKEVTKSYMGSYIDLRYKRFLDNVTPKLNKMIYERTEQILSGVFKEMPNIIKSVG